MIFFVLIFAFSVIGIGEAIYLIKKRIVAEKPICLVNEHCETVLNSKYNKIFSVHIDTLGLLFYIAVLFIASFLIIGIQPMILWDFALKILILAASLMSVFFTYLQWKVIRAWCFWCLMSAFTIWFMGIIMLINILI